MISREYEFVTERLDTKSWNDITREFNKEYQASLSSNALRKRYEREVSKIEVLGDDSIEQAVKIIRTSPIKPTELARRLNLNLDGLEDLMDDIFNSRAAIKIHQGYLVFDKSAPTPDNLTHYTKLLTEGEWTKWAIIADTHVCSIHEQLELLYEFYKIAEQEKCKGVLCAGDLLAGNGTVYRGQIQDLRIIGEDKQINYFCSVFPQTSLKTYAIAGNHDLDLWKQCGSDIVQKISEKREDIEYLGKMAATLEDEETGTTIMLKHGDGGLGAFKSYKPQKIVDNLKPEQVADITVIGHYHINLYIPNHRGSAIILPGCFEAQSDYLLKKDLMPEVGGCILSLKMADTKDGKRIIRHKPDFIDMGYCET